MKKTQLSNIIEFQNKSHIKAGDGLQEGKFPFFTSSSNISKFYDFSQFNTPSLIFGTGGNASIHICESPFSVSTDCLVAQLRTEATKNFELKFIYYFLYGNIWILEKGFRGAGLKHISKNYINKILIPEISLDDQKQIVKILDQANRLIQKRKQAISLLDGYLKSVFLEIFGDSVNNPKKWDIKTLGEIISSITSGSRGWAKYYSDSGSLFITIKNVGRDNKLLLDDLSYVNPPMNAEARRTRVKDGDVLLSITADLGRSAVIRDITSDAYINQHLAILRLKENYVPEYIAEFICSTGGQLQIQKLNKGAAKAGLNFNDVKSIKIPIPPFDVQNKFNLIKNQVQFLDLRLKKSLKETQNLLNTLTQKAFKGELIK